MSERNAVHLAFDRFGKEASFEKKSGSWYRRGAEVTAVSNLLLNGSPRRLGVEFRRGSP